jgi:broad specificity phosphatase PhoE
MKKLLLNPLRTKVNRAIHHDSSKILLIRHAQSKYNKAIKEIDRLLNEGKIDKVEHKLNREKIKFSEDLIDCEITDQGYTECKEAGRELSNIKIKYVIVSPMVRCLMTCNNVLKSIAETSPNSFSSINPEIVVYPYIFEKIEDNCDLLRDVHQTMKSYQEISHKTSNFSKTLKYNWSMMNDIPDLYLYQLKFCDIVHKSYSFDYHSMALRHYQMKQEYIHHRLILEAMEKLDEEGKFIESSRKTLERLTSFKFFLNNFIEEKNLKEDEKVLVVGHSILFKHFISTHLEEDTYEPYETNGSVLNNCETVSLTFH